MESFSSSLPQVEGPVLVESQTFSTVAFLAAAAAAAAAVEAGDCSIADRQPVQHLMMSFVQRLVGALSYLFASVVLVQLPPQPPAVVVLGRELQRTCGFLVSSLSVGCCCGCVVECLICVKTIAVKTSETTVLENAVVPVAAEAHCSCLQNATGHCSDGLSALLLELV